MRVATIFTGVAACTAGLTHAANAQDIRPAIPGVPAVPAGTISGNIKSVASCGSRGIDRTWLHVSTVSNFSVLAVPETRWMSDCFGNAGQYKWPRGTGIVAECGGNNYGFLSGATASENWWWTSFGPGTTYRTLNKAHLSYVFISRWAGTDTCKEAPNFDKEIAGT
jgi:hypothetical protein